MRNSDLKSLRRQLEADDSTAAMLSALRGQSVNDDDRQLEGIEMRVVETAGDLPLTYDPEALAEYFGARPRVVAQRLAQIWGSSLGVVAQLGWDWVRGELQDAEVRRAAELRKLLVSLGPFFIKLGQALSIRPDVLSPRAMYELQQLCDKVPSFDSELAFATIRDELGVASVDEVFSEITAEPVAAASLGQVYKATLRATGDVVAVKVQRPFVLETVSLDLHLTRELGKLLRRSGLANKLDIVDLLDDFATRILQELDYQIECSNGERMRADMAKLPRVVIPKNYPSVTTRRVHVAEWVEGEKLSQSKANDVNALVNLGVVTYLTQLLETGFFHADPHPGNMLRTPDGRLVILDFGLVTEITEDQKYGMIEAIAHLIHRDYDQIGADFVNLDFIPRGTDIQPIVPALSRVFDAALSGGGAKTINFNDLAADLAEITFRFPFRIPSYFAVLIRAIGVLEGIALVADPDFAIIDEAWPYISRRLLTDPSSRMQAALRYTVYGKSKRFDVDRLVDMLDALEKFAAVKALAGDALLVKTQRDDGEDDNTREALRFFFSNDGSIFRDFVADEVVASIDAAGRAVATDQRVARASRRFGVDRALAKLAPPLDDDDRKSLANVRALAAFLLQQQQHSSAGRFLPPPSSSSSLMAPTDNTGLLATLDVSPTARRQIQTILPLLAEHAPQLRAFAATLASKLAEKQLGRTFDLLVDFLAPPRPAS